MRLSEITRFIPAKADSDHNQWLPLWLHAEDTAGMLCWLYHHWLPAQEARAVFPNLAAEEISQMLNLLGLLHDLGKATPVFAAHLVKSGNMPEIRERMENTGFPSFWPSEYTVTHSAAGEALLVERFHAEEGFASIIGAHHGKPQPLHWNASDIWTDYEHLLCGRKQDGFLWREAQREVVQYAEEKTGLRVTEIPVIPQTSQMLLCGLLIMSDWIASNSRYFPLIPAENSGTSVPVKERLEAAVSRLHLSASWHAEATEEWLDDIYDLRFGRGSMRFIPRPVQQQVAETAAELSDPGIMILEAPMGVGKTEAALVAAELIAAKTEGGGIFFGLPTQATSNAIFTRVLDWAKRQSEDTVNTIMLSHRMACFQPDYQMLLEGSTENVISEESGIAVHSFFLGKKTALLSSFTIGTVDQLLMAALNRKHVMLRQLGLAGKVIILDEVHAYDAYMTSYLQQALQWLGEWKVPVILLSATLPALQREKLLRAYSGKTGGKDDLAKIKQNKEYPLLTWTDGDRAYQKKLSASQETKDITWKIIEDEARIMLLSDALADGGCAGIICNTVGRAQRMAEEVRRCMNDTEIILLHAQFTLPDRIRTEQQVLEKLGKQGQRPGKLVLIGTQVIEQSLDIDFDLLITDLCPIDLLLQRIGRLHRHDRERPLKLRVPQCWITAWGDQEVREQRIYDEYLMLRTRACLPEKIRIPTDIAELVHQVYDREAMPGDETEWFMEAKRKREQTIGDMESKAAVFQIKKPVSSRYQKQTMHGLLDRAVSVNENAAEASVRSGTTSIEVLLMKMNSEGNLCFVSEDKQPVSASTTPSVEEAMAIARQRLKLPWKLCAPWTMDRTIAALEQMSLRTAEWQASPWLQGELILILNTDGTARINEWEIRYDQMFGLRCEKAEQDNCQI